MALISEKPFTLDRIVRIGISVLIAWGLIWLLGYLSDVLIPFALAALLAYLINPVVDFFQHTLRVKYRGLAVVVSLLLIFGIVFLASYFLIPLIIYEVTHMGELLANLVENTNWEKESSKYLPADIIRNLQEFAAREDVQNFFNNEDFGGLASNALQKILPGVWSVFSGALNIVIGVLGIAIIILYLVFLLIDYDEIFDNWKNYIPPSIKDKFLEVLNNFNDAMHNYFRAQAVIAGIVGILFAIGFFSMGLPMGIVLGILIGVLNMIPYLQNIAIIPAAFLALMYSLESGKDFWLIVGLIAAIFVVVQAIQDYFLTPRIMGKAMNLNAAFIILSLSIWGKLLGLLGLLIALPLTYLIFAYYKQFINKASSAKPIGFSTAGTEEKKT